MTSDMKNRPDWQVEATQKNNNSTDSLPPDRVFGRVRLDLAKYASLRWKPPAQPLLDEEAL